jgi:23S rRNA pseudouridine1911/1915/1917 synthase
MKVKSTIDFRRGSSPFVKRFRKPAATPDVLTVRKLDVQEPATLLAFLIKSHPGKGRNAIKSMLSRGQVSVDGRTITAYDWPLQRGSRVEIRMGKPPAPFRFAGMSILHEDADLIVIRKDAGLLSIATADEKYLTAYRQLSDYVKQSDPRGRIFVLHRLDRDTSGVMMFGRSERVQQKMQTAWKKIVIERIYVALVEGQVRQPEGTVESWLKENASLKMYSSKRTGDGLHAVTRFRVLRAGRHYSLLEIRLDTGRKNQIRVHMHDIGHPIAGDKKYGARTNPIGRLGLHASVLAFIHPSTGELMRFNSELPKSFLQVFKPD